MGKKISNTIRIAEAKDALFGVRFGAKKWE